MSWRTPAFWYRAPGALSTCLAPLGALYAQGTARKLARGAQAQVGAPVICVGNLTAGGTGKTPVVMALAEKLAEHCPHILSRGYGGHLQGPVQVDATRHSADEVGDEPLLLAGFAPVWVSKDRHAGAQAAAQNGAGLIILDDGFQNAQLHYDLRILVVDAARGFGNGCVIPAGPLREPVARGLNRADLVITIGDEAAQTRFVDQWAGAIEKPLLTAKLTPLPTGIDLAGKPVLAFAGIGHPDRFFATLRALGADLQREIALGDHQSLSPGLMARIARDAAASGALIVTTEKDACRLPQSFRQQVLTLPVRLQLSDPNALDPYLDRVVPVHPAD